MFFETEMAARSSLLEGWSGRSISPPCYNYTNLLPLASCTREKTIKTLFKYFNLRSIEHKRRFSDFHCTLLEWDIEDLLSEVFSRVSTVPIFPPNDGYAWRDPKKSWTRWKTGKEVALRIPELVRLLTGDIKLWLRYAYNYRTRG